MIIKIIKSRYFILIIKMYLFFILNCFIISRSKFIESTKKQKLLIINGYMYLFYAVSNDWHA